MGSSRRSPAALATPVCGSRTRSAMAATSTPTAVQSIRGRRRRRSCATASRSRSSATGLVCSMIPGWSRTLAATARLALDNERLRAELLAHLADLRDSRARIVATGDRRAATARARPARRRAAAARRAHARAWAAQHAAADAARARPGAAGSRPARRTASCALRSGTCARSPMASSPPSSPTRASPRPSRRWPKRSRERSGSATFPSSDSSPAIESAAYRVIADTVKHAVEPRSRSPPVSRDGLLVVEVESDRSPADLTDLEDRLGALDGTLELEHTTGGPATIRAEIPCAS